MLSVGQTMAMIPEYTKAKTAALRIMRLNKRQSQIDPFDNSGIILVIFTSLYLISAKANRYFIFRMK
jgi:hypothetical protein